MIYDRDYMRDGNGSRWGSPVTVLLMVMLGIFLLECVLVVHGGWTLSSMFGLSLPAVRGHEYWRLVTYQFLHQAPWPWHLLFNGLALWFVGRGLIELVGVSRFWWIFLGSGLAGALVELVAQGVNPAYGLGPTVGSSACVLGVLAAFCLIEPGREMTFFLYFLPVQLRAITIFRVTLWYAVFGTVFPHGGIAHAAHLGGVLAGAAMMRYGADERASEAWAQFVTWLRRKFAEAGPRRVPGRVSETGAGSMRPPAVVAAVRVSGRPTRRDGPDGGEPDSPDEFMRREVDPILDKISAHGLHSLTDQERRVLERARERMRKK